MLCEGCYAFTKYQREVIWRQCERLTLGSYLTNQTFYNTMFTAFKSLLIQEHALMLDYFLYDIQGWLSDDMNQLTLQEAEIRMFSNMDLTSGFEVRGEMITQMMIYERFEKIKGWLQELLYGFYMPNTRFTMPLQMD